MIVANSSDTVTNEYTFGMKDGRPILTYESLELKALETNTWISVVSEITEITIITYNITGNCLLKGTHSWVQSVPNQSQPGISGTSTFRLKTK